MSPRLSWSLIDCNIMIRRYINSVLNIVAAVAVLTAFAPMLSWSRLEGVPVPNHFDIHGVVDRVGDRSILLVVALVGLGVYILTLLAQIFPNIVNLQLELQMTPSGIWPRSWACCCPCCSLSAPTPRSR